MNTPTHPTFRILQSIADIHIDFHTDIGRMPKLARYTLGTSLLDRNYSLLGLIVLALKKSGKSRLLLLEKADYELTMIRITLRLMYKMKHLNDRRYAFLSEKLIGIGKQLGGLIKMSGNRQRPDESDR